MIDATLTITESDDQRQRVTTYSLNSQQIRQIIAIVDPREDAEVVPFPDRDDVELVFEEDSDSDNWSTYRVSKTYGGEWSCECNAFKFRSGDCKHIRRARAKYLERINR